MFDNIKDENDCHFSNFGDYNAIFIILIVADDFNEFGILLFL